MALYADLGQVRLSNASTDFRLTVSTSVKASCLTVDSISPSSYLQTLLTPHSSWICRGSGLHLEIRLVVNGQCFGKHPWAIEVQKSLRHVIAGAELWDQLNILASLPLPQIPEVVSPEDEAFIILNLSHSQADKTVFRPNLHRISSGVPMADIKPPAGVLVYGLEKVSLSLDISSPEHVDSKVILEISQNSPSQYLHDVESESNSGLTDEDEMLWDGEHYLTKCNMWAFEDETAPVDPRAPDAAPFQDTPNGIAQLLGMVDAALRMFICSKPARLARGTKIVADDRITQLADIAPAIWSPGYLPAVAQRACFLPTISHALSHSLLRNAKSPVLKSKLQKLIKNEESQATLGVDTGEQNQGPHAVNPQSLYRSINNRLWNILQRGVYDVGAARILKSIEADAEPCSSKLDQSEMLDDLHDTSRDVLLRDSSGDQPLSDSNTLASECIPREHMLEEEVDDIWPENVLTNPLGFTLEQPYKGDFITMGVMDVDDNSIHENRLYSCHENGDDPQDILSNTSKVDMSHVSDEFDISENDLFISEDFCSNESLSSSFEPYHRYSQEDSHGHKLRSPEFYDDIDAGYFTSSQASIIDVVVPPQEIVDICIEDTYGKISSAISDRDWGDDNDLILGKTGNIARR